MPEEHLLAVVVGVVLLLLVAAAAAIGLKRTNLPYATGLVVVGLLIGAFSSRIELLEGLPSLTPEIILFVFLPTLVFESAFNLDSRLLARNLTPVIALAAPGLLLSTAIVGGLMAWLTPLGLGSALLFGALISATDPVAVIALFKELGAPKRLAILVEGESLFNDATAIVLFRIILAVIAAGSVGAATVGSGVVDFVVVFAGGLVVGAGIGYLMIRTISLAEDDPLVEVTLSTVVAYAAFITADHYLGVSGVMATVGAGVVVGGYGSTRFTPAVKEYVEQFWEYAAFVANSLIFLLVGLSVQLGGLLEHWGPIVIGILAMLLARTITVYGLTPLLGRLPGAEPIGWRYQSVMIWGGLRGAVALALALSLPESFADRELLGTLALGAVLFSLLLGGVTMRPFMRWLGLDQPTFVERVGRAQAELAGKREGMARIAAVMDAGHYSARLLHDVEQEYRRKTQRAEEALVALHAHPEFKGDTMRRVLWSEVLTVERRVYRSRFDRGLLSEPVLRELELAIDLVRDGLKRGQVSCELPNVVPFEMRFEARMMALINRLAPRSRLAQRHQVRALAAKYEHDAAALEAGEVVLREIDGLATLSGVAQEVVAECRQAYESRAAAAMTRLDEIANLFPEYARAVQLQAIRRTALDGEADAVERMAQQGAIPASVASEARKAVEREQRTLARQPVSGLEPRPEDLLLKVPFFQRLGRDDFTKVLKNLNPRTILAGEAIVQQGQRGASLFLIARGVVAVMATGKRAEAVRVASLSAGDFFGETALLTGGTRTASVVAVTDCHLFELTKPDVDALCKVCSGVKEALAHALRERRRGRDAAVD